MSINFGKTLEQDIRSFSNEELRSLLTTYGVITFKKQSISDEEYLKSMSAFGRIQNFVEQRVPVKFVDRTHDSIILMNNNDFLGKTREQWHIDHTYQGPKYLPIRAMYCYGTCDVGNRTSFKDLKFISQELIKKFPTIVNANANYRILNIPRPNLQKVSWPCEYIDRIIVRYDTRIDSLDQGLDADEFKRFTQQLINNDDVPTYFIDWEIGDLVIFDNNQALHRRSQLTGEVLHKRVTTDHWSIGQ